MTGFGKASLEYNGQRISVTIKSLNSKQFDLSLRMPSRYKVQEYIVRPIVARSLQRGKVELNIQVEDLRKGERTNTTINKALLEAYAKDIKDISLELGLSEPNNMMEILLRIPGVITTSIDEDQDEEIPLTEWQTVIQTIEIATRELTNFRLQEGEMLTKIFIESVNKIRSLLAESEQYETDRITTIKARIEAALEKAHSESYDSSRLEQELIFYIEKLDVSEEKSRLRNHLDYFIETLGIEESQGKKLGFISQEIGREINTLGSKSNSADMQRLVVMMKDELEQIKEQVLNTL